VPSIGVTNGRRASALLSASVNSADRGVGGNLSGSFAGARFGVFGGVAGRNIGDLRPGDGIDSHAAVTRFLGIRSDRLMPSHLPGTGFDQYGLQASVNWLPRSNDHVVLSYRQGRQNDGKRYDQLLGGDGNLVADLRDLALDLVFGRYERLQAGWLDHVAVTGAVNSQHEERVNPGRQRQSSRGDQQRAGADHPLQRPGHRAEAVVDRHRARLWRRFLSRAHLRALDIAESRERCR